MLPGECVRIRRTLCAGLIASVGVVLTGCGGSRDPELTQFQVARQVAALNANPGTSDFVIQAANSVRLQTGAKVSGGDVAAMGAGGGPFLSGGVAIDLAAGAQVEATHSLIGDSVRLGSGAKVGDVQTNHLSETHAQRGSVSTMVALPSMPALAAVLPSTLPLAVTSGQTFAAQPGAFGNVTVGTGAKLRMAAGEYDMASLTLTSGARLEILGPVQIHVLGRLSAATGSYIGAAANTFLSAKDLRIEVSGVNGTDGALEATPKSAVVSSGSHITALMLAPNGTLSLATGVVATGAFFARDVDIAALLTREWA